MNKKIEKKASAKPGWTYVHAYVPELFRTEAKAHAATRGYPNESQYVQAAMRAFVALGAKAPAYVKPAEPTPETPSAEPASAGGPAV